MKKLFAFAAAAAALCLSSSASALDADQAFGEIRVIGGPRLASPGGQILVGMPTAQYCYYTFEWVHPFTSFLLTTCEIQESRLTGKSCAQQSQQDVAGASVMSVANNCYGFNAAGFELPATLALTELGIANNRLLGIARLGNATYNVVVR